MGPGSAAAAARGSPCPLWECDGRSIVAAWRRCTMGSMRAWPRSRLLVGCTIALWACGGEDLVLPTDPPPGVAAGGREPAGRGSRSAPARPADRPPRGSVGGGHSEPDRGLGHQSGRRPGQPDHGDDRRRRLRLGRVDAGARAGAEHGRSPGAERGIGHLYRDRHRGRRQRRRRNRPSPTRSSITIAPASVPVRSGIATVTVTVLDDQGRPVPGATVTLQATGSGNTVTQPTGTTGADGVAIGTIGSRSPVTRW